MKIMIEDHDDYDKARIMLDLLFHKDNKNQKIINGDEEPATTKQIYFLEKNEIPHDTHISKKQASEIIDQFINGGQH